MVLATDGEDGHDLNKMSHQRVPLNKIRQDTILYSESKAKQAVITLLQKKDEDKRFISNWRPISLIKVDTKIASKTLAISVLCGKL